MNRLLKEACKFAPTGSKGRKAYIAAIAHRRDGTVVRSHNILADERKPHAHAEARVARKCDVGAIVHVARVRRDNGEVAMAKPCPTCVTALRNRGVAKVYYTIGPNEWGCLEF